MSTTMLLRALRDVRWTALWYAIGSAIYVSVMVAFYPTMRDNTEMLDELMKVYPEAIRQAFGIEDISSFIGFIGAEFLSVVWPLILAVFLIMAGTATVAQEIERGTVELWLSVPTRRARLLAAKTLAIAAGVAFVIACTLLVMSGGALVISESLSVRGLIALFAVVMSFTLAVLGYSVLLSTMFNERGKAAGIAAIVTLGSYLAWVVASISDSWSWMRYLSIFTAYDPQQALRSGNVGWSGMLAMLAVFSICTVAALWTFEHRDITP